MLPSRKIRSIGYWEGLLGTSEHLKEVREKAEIKDNLYKLLEIDKFHKHEYVEKKDLTINFYLDKCTLNFARDVDLILVRNFAQILSNFKGNLFNSFYNIDSKSREIDLRLTKPELLHAIEESFPKSYCTVS